MHIALLIHTMGPGGAERVMSMLANGLAHRGHQVDLWTLGAECEGSFYPLDREVRLTHLRLGRLPEKRGKLSLALDLYRLLGRLRAHVSAVQPDVLVAFIDATNVIALVSTLGLGIPVVISERSDPRKAPLAWIWRLGRKLVYPWADALVVQSREVRGVFSAWVQRRVVVIPNPVPSVPSKASSRSHDARRRLLAVGRLGHEKGFDLLLRAFGQVAARFPDWDLEIVGEGQERGRLEALRETLELGQRVGLPGVATDISSRYEQADLFVLCSRYEGFPNALCEAMAHGLPVVATSCSGGIREIIRPEVDGVLVPPEDPGALGEALGRVMGDAELRSRLGSSARAVVERFNPASVLDAWEGVFTKVCRGDGSALSGAD